MGILSVFIVATLTFFLMNLVPGGPFVAEKSISKAAQEALEAKFGLDKPLLQRYTTYMTDFLQGDMGFSLRQRGRTVSDIIFSKFPVSARLAGIAVVVALCVGIPLGCVSAYNRGKLPDNFIIVLGTCGIAIPSFISSVLLLYTFGSWLQLLPTMGLNDAASYIMPVTALAIYPTAYITRLMRSSLLDVMGQDYIRTAKAKGLSSFMTLFKHALRNALILSLGYLPRSLLIAAVNVFPFLMLVRDPYGFLQAAFLWTALYFALAAYVNTFLLRRVLAPYLTDENTEEE